MVKIEGCNSCQILYQIRGEIEGYNNCQILYQIRGEIESENSAKAYVGTTFDLSA